MFNSASLPSHGDPRPLRIDFVKAGKCTDSEQAFSLRWSEAHGPLRNFLLGFLSDRSEVDDCLQEVALLAWRKGPKEASREQFLAFSMECAKRLAMAEVRKKYRKRDHLISLENFTTLIERSSELELEDWYGPQARVAALRSCLGTLDSGARRLLELRYSASKPGALKDHARKSGGSMDAIYKKLERLRTILKSCVTRKLKKHSDEPGS